MSRYDYSKLLGRIKEFGYTQQSIAHAIGIHPSTFSQKIHGRVSFTQKEISSLCSSLSITNLAISDYFFTHKV